MLPKSILSKMSAGLSLATVSVALNLSCVAVENDGAATVAAATTPELSTELLSTVRKNLDGLDAQEPEKAQAAFQDIFKLGKPVLPFLTQHMKKLMDVERRTRVQRLIDFIKAGGDPCPRCGKG